MTNSLFDEIEHVWKDPHTEEPKDCQRCLFILTRNHYLDEPECLAGTYFKAVNDGSFYSGRFVLGYNHQNLGWYVEKDSKDFVALWAEMPKIPKEYESEPPKKKER